MELKKQQRSRRKPLLSPVLKDKVKQLWVDWLLVSTTHGLPSISKTRSRFIRIMWALFFLLSSTYCLYSIIILLVQFFTYDVIINLKISDEKTVNFPAVAICNLNAIDRDNAQYYITHVLGVNNISYDDNVTLINMNPQTVKYLIEATIVAAHNLTLTKSLGISLNMTFLSCYFNSIQCSESDFVWFYDFTYGNCYTFNSGYDQLGDRVPIKQISEDGSDHSFRFEIFLGNEYTTDAFTLQSGARVVIYNQTYRPIPSSEGVELSSNYLTNIAITQSFLYKLSSPYSECIKDTQSPNSYDSFYYKAMFNVLNITNYRQKECLDLCQQDFIKQSCKCLDPGLPIIYTNETICSNLAEVLCVLSTRTNYSLQTSTSCTGCPLECDSVSYTLQTSRSRYPTSYYTTYLQLHTNLVSRFPPGTPINANYIQKNILLMNIYYADLAFSNVVEVPAVTFDMLMGNLGGYLGLFVGMSLLSLVEWVEIFISVIFMWRKMKN